MTINQRIKSIRDECKLSQSDFAASIGLERPNYAKLEIGKQKPSIDLISKIVRIYHKDYGWLIDGVEPLNAKEFNEPAGEYLKRNTLPVYESPITASEVEVYNDLQHEGPAFYVSIPQFKDCKFGKVIYGHSMYPTITSGSYVFCKPVPNKASFLPGEIYYIEYDNFGVCKRLQKAGTKDEVLLVSDNDEIRTDGTRRYESFILKIDQIRELYLVKGYFNQNHN